MAKSLKRIRYALIVLLRILLPLAFYKYHSVYMVIAIFFLDLTDMDFAENVLTLEWYQRMDKLLDFWWYVWILTYVLEFHPDLSSLFILLFVYRLIGQSLLMMGVKRKILILFPNYYETVFFLFYFSINVNFLHPLIEGKNLYYSLVFIFIFKILNEYFIHVGGWSFKEVITGRKRRWVRTINI